MKDKDYKEISELVYGIVHQEHRDIEQAIKEDRDNFLTTFNMMLRKLDGRLSRMDEAIAAMPKDNFIDFGLVIAAIKSIRIPETDLSGLHNKLDALHERVRRIPGEVKLPEVIRIPATSVRLEAVDLPDKKPKTRAEPIEEGEPEEAVESEPEAGNGMPYVPPIEPPDNAEAREGPDERERMVLDALRGMKDRGTHETTYSMIAKEVPSLQAVQVQRTLKRLERKSMVVESEGHLWDIKAGL